MRILIFLKLFLVFKNLILCEAQSLNFTLGSCVVQYSQVCAESFVKFFVSSSERPDNAPTPLNGEHPILPRWVRRESQFKVIIHGYGGNNEFNGTKNIQDEYLRRPNTTVVIVDWGRLAVLPCYPTAALNTKQAGHCVAKFLLLLQKMNTWFLPYNVHLVGFSLGAHVAGFASNMIEMELKQKIKRITGLDPAPPFFTSGLSGRKLDKSDASFVDVIHTNAGIFGKIEPIGHVDFYVNGGQIQPNCNESYNIPLCSHIMSTIYFRESIMSEKGFWGQRCSSIFQWFFGWCTANSRIPNDDLILMGEQCSKESRGIVFVTTRSQPPYAMGKNYEPEEIEKYE